MRDTCGPFQHAQLGVVFVFALLLAGAASGGTQVETFDDGSLDGVWLDSDAFGGQPGSIILAGGTCAFHKTGAAPGSTRSVAMHGSSADHRISAPWSVEYTVPDTADLTEDRGCLVNRFWKPGAAVLDWVYIAKSGGQIRIGVSGASAPMYSFDAAATNLLKVRFDVSVTGLKVYATTNIGSYGTAADVKWQSEVAADTPIGLCIMATDDSGPSVAAPFDIRIDNLALTAASLSSTQLGDVPRFNPRIEPVDAKNLLPNASFECGPHGWSSLGIPTGWGGELSGLHGSVETSGAWHGDRCLRIDLGPGVSPVTCFDVWPPAREVQSAPLAANLGWMRVTPGEPVTLSAYMRSSVDGAKARLLLRFADDALNGILPATAEVALTQQWARYTLTHTAPAGDVCAAVGPDMTSTPDVPATCWIDAVQLEAGTAATAFETREPVEVTVSTGRYGNVFDAGPVQLVVCAANRGAEPVAIALHLELEDYFGTRLAPHVLTLQVPAGARAENLWALTLPGKGFFRGQASWTANGRNHVALVKFTVIEPYLHEDSPFGLNHPATTAGQFALLSKAGVRWVRTGALNWEFVEPVQGQVSWAAQDDQIAYLRSAAMHTLVTFPNPSTNWASEAPSSVPATAWYRLAYAPSEPELLFKYVGSAVARYRDTVTCWEFLNEPLWVPDFCLPQSGGYTMADYIELLQGAHAAMKAADPDCKIIGGISIEPIFPMGDEFIAGGGLKYCDAYNLHPYGGFKAPEDFIPDMNRILGVMDSHGGRKPIWATELGYYAVDDKPWTPWVAPPNAFSPSLLLASERVCADYMVRQAIILLAHGVEKLFYHEPIEGPVNYSQADIENPFLNTEAVPKKCYTAVAALANILGPAPKYAGPATFPPGVGGTGAGPIGYAFETSSGSVAALWAPGQELTLEGIGVTAGVTAYDVMGNPLTPPLTLGESPVYLVSASIPAQRLTGSWFCEQPRGLSGEG